MSQSLNGYVCFYGSKRAEIHAASLFEAKTKAVAHFKAPKSKAHMVTVTLAEVGGKQVTHTACD